MQKQGLFRRLIKWGGVAFCLVLLAAWGVSTKWHFAFAFKTHVGLIEGNLEHGVIHVLWDQGTHYVNHEPEYVGKKMPLGFMRSWGENLDWSFDPFTQGLDGFSGQAELRFHMGLPLLIACFCTFFYWRHLARRFPPGHCFVCGYNLTGTDHERCPECGKILSAEVKVKITSRRRPSRILAMLLMLGIVAGVVASAWWVENLGRNSTTGPNGTTARQVKGSEDAIRRTTAFLRNKGKLPDKYKAEASQIFETWVVVFDTGADTSPIVVIPAGPMALIEQPSELHKQLLLEMQRRRSGDHPAS